MNDATPTTKIAFTFDDGPHEQNTPALLRLATASSVKLTFFVVGSRVEKHASIIRRQICEGHEIGNHSWSHPDLTKLDHAAVHLELQRTEDVIVHHGGVRPRVFRPPYGLITTRQRGWVACDFNYRTVLWTVDSLDWRNRNPNVIIDCVLRTIRAGSVVLFHDVHNAAIEAMPQLLESLLSRGFTFATVSELLSEVHARNIG